MFGTKKEEEQKLKRFMVMCKGFLFFIIVWLSIQPL